MATGLDVKVGDVERDCIALVKAVRAQLKIPLAIKLHPHFSAIGELVRSLDEAGADALVLFNRLYEPDIDLVRLGWKDTISLSNPNEIRLGLLWLAQLSGQQLRPSLAASTGVDTSSEIIKYLLAGADVVMTTSSILQNGPDHIRTLLSGVTTWLEARGFASVNEIRGLLRRTIPAEKGEPCRLYQEPVGLSRTWNRLPLQIATASEVATRRLLGLICDPSRTRCGSCASTGPPWERSAHLEVALSTRFQNG